MYVLRDAASVFVLTCLLFVLQVNVLALCICSREAYQSMKERNIDDGHIININRYSGSNYLI